MINKVVSGVSNALDVFGYPIYFEKVPQGFQTPSFMIKHNMSNQAQSLSNRYEDSHFLIVQFFGKTKEQMFEMAYKLNDTLEYLTVDNNLVRTKDRQSKVDEVLTFTFNCSIRIVKDKPIDEVMANFKEGITVK